MNEARFAEIMIEGYAAGSHMTVCGRRYTQDLKIVGNEIKSDWWRREGHRMTAEDVADILATSPEILVVGTGYAGSMRIAEALRQDLKKKHILLVAEPTDQAVQTFNRMRADGRNAAGAFHLTC